MKQIFISEKISYKYLRKYLQCNYNCIFIYENVFLRLSEI